jgi:hypothetical protein
MRVDWRGPVGGLVAGNVLHGMVVPPVPYRLRLDVRLQRFTGRGWSARRW